MIILTSKGFQTERGEVLIRKGIKKALKEVGEITPASKTILLCSPARYGIGEILLNKTLKFGFDLDNIRLFDGTQSISKFQPYETFDFCYVGEGNVFEIKDLLKIAGIDEIIYRSFLNGGTYIGASAGAMLSGSTIEFGMDFEANRIGLTDMSGLNLIKNSVIVPHYSRREFERWKAASSTEINRYEFVDYVPENGYKIYVNRGV